MGDDTGCSIAVLVVFAALAVVLAILGDSVLTGALVFAGILLVMHGSNRAAGGRAAQGWAEIVAGVGASAAAMWLGGMGGRWWWLPVWLFLGYVVLFNGNKARMTDRRHGDSLIAFGALLMIFSVLAPLWVYPALASEAPESAVGFSVSDGLGAAWDLVGTVVTSLWGWLNLLFMVFIGVAMWRRHGAWVLPALVLAAAFVVGGFSSSAGADLAAAAGHSPASWMKSLVLASNDHWGTAGWGILLLGVGLVAFAAPLLRKLLAINRVVMAAEVVKRREGDEASLRYMVERGCGPGTMMLVVSAFQGLIVGIGIALWVGLRWAAGTAGALPFDPFRIPDLAVPNFRPVWQLSYFALAVAVGASAVLASRIMVRLRVSERVPVLTNPVWQIGIVVIGAFLAPAGVFLLSLSGIWMQAALAPLLAGRAGPEESDVGPSAASMLGYLEALRSAQTTSEPGVGTVSEEPPLVSKEPPPQERAAGGAQAVPGQGVVGNGERPVWERGSGEDERPVWERGGGVTPGEAAVAGGLVAGGAALGGAAGEPADELLGSQWFVHDEPIVDLACLHRVELVVLDEKGDVTLYRREKAARRKRLAVSRPLGLGVVADGHLALVDGDGRVAELSLAEEDYGGEDPMSGRAHIVHAGVTEAIDYFAVSPSGTMVAFAASARPQVSAFFLSSEITRVLADGVGRPSALGFAADGRRLAVGTATGEVHIVDVGGRGVIGELRDDRAAGSAVSAVAGARDGRWLVAYDNMRLALWGDEGGLVRDIDAGAAVVCLAVDEISGSVAFATSRGSVRVRDADLDEVLVDGRMASSAVRRLVFMGTGSEIVCAGAGGEVRYLAH